MLRLVPLLALALQAPPCRLSPADVGRAVMFGDTSGHAWEGPAGEMAGVRWYVRVPAGRRVVVKVHQAVLALLDCSGRRLWQDVIGEIEQLRFQDVTGDRVPELVVTHKTGWGTGYLQLSVSVYAIGDSLALLWRSIMEEHSWWDPAASGRWEPQTVVRFPRPGLIEQVGLRYKLQCGRDSCARTSLVPVRQFYSWNRRDSRFVLGKRGAQLAT